MTECRAFILYGSHARGDADHFSDIDLLTVARDMPNVNEIAALVPESPKHLLQVSHYTWEEIESMSRYGSLFLHHIANEATTLLYEGNAQARMSKLLGSLPPYQLAGRDLRGFRSVVKDVQSGLAAGLPPCFELAVLGGVARHASVLACYMVGVPTFGRDCIARAVGFLEMPEVLCKLQLAHSFRLFEERKCGVLDQVSRNDVEHVIEIINKMLSKLEGLVYARPKRLPSSDRIYKGFSRGH